MKEDDVNGFIPPKGIVNKRTLFAHIYACMKEKELTELRLTFDELQYIIDLILEDWSPTEKDLEEYNAWLKEKVMLVKENERR